VLFSGITVAVSLAALALTTVPFLRSIGLAGLLIPLISIAVSATLLPVILDGIGPRLEWPRCKPARTVSPLWTRIARGVVAHPGWSATAALAVLAVLITPVFSLNLGEPQATATAATAPAAARAGLDALTSSGIGPGMLRPTEILLPAHSPALPSRAHISVVTPSAWSRGGHQIADGARQATACGMRCCALWAAIKAATATAPSRPSPRGPRCA
jgi:RND superfamily putative drug exporter